MKQSLALLGLLIGSAWSWAQAPAKPIVNLRRGQTQVIVRERVTSVVSEKAEIVEVQRRSENLVTLLAKGVGETNVRIKWKDRDESFTVKVAGGPDPESIVSRAAIVRKAELPPANPVVATLERRDPDKREVVPVSPDARPALPAPTPVTIVPVKLVKAERPSLWLSLRMQPDPSQTGVLEVIATYANRGEGRASGVFIRNVLPPEFDFIEGSAKPTAKWESKTRELSWDLGELLAPAANAPSVARQQTVSFKVRVGGRSSAKVANVATIECAELDSIVASNTASWSTQSPALLAVFAMPDTMLTKKNVKVPMLDVRGDEYQVAVDRLEGLGVLGGLPGRIFHPDRPINRAESVKLVVLGIDLKDTRDATRISYALGREALVTVTVKAEGGRVVRTLVKAQKKGAGEHALTWDGRNDGGVFVPPGNYRFEARVIDPDGVANTLTGALTIVGVQPRSFDGVPSFPDIRKGDWFAGIIAEAERREYVNGYPDKTFRPRAALSRVEATAIVVRALGLEAEARKRMDNDAGFIDGETIPKWARGYVNVGATTAPKAGGELIIGYPGNTFQPLNPLRRKEAAAMVGRLIDKETKRQAFVAGSISPGVTVSIAGKTISGGPDGKFREAIDLIPGELTPIAIVSR